MTEQQRGRRAIETGSTGKHVAANLARLRKVRGLTTRQLSAVLERVGRSIPASGITRMEKRERQVTVDDLTAFAAVFGVSPSALLLPLADDPAKSIEVTGAGPVHADAAWDWMDGRRPVKVPDDKDPGTARFEFELYGRPPGRRAKPNDPAYFWMELRDAGVDVDAVFRKLYANLHKDDGKDRS